MNNNLRKYSECCDECGKYTKDYVTSSGYIVCYDCSLTFEKKKTIVNKYKNLSQDVKKKMKK